jgi:hypothetical protein
VARGLAPRLRRGGFSARFCGRGGPWGETEGNRLMVGRVLGPHGWQNGVSALLQRARKGPAGGARADFPCRRGRGVEEKGDKGGAARGLRGV